MDSVLKYSTTFLKDKFIVVDADGSIGHLFKASWLGDDKDIVCRDEKYRIKKLGSFLNQTVEIYDGRGEQVARIYTKFPFFRLGRRGKVVLVSGREFEWRESGLFNRKWELIDKSGMIIRSTEANGLFTINGDIQAQNESEETRLLGLIGLYLRDSLGVQNAVTFWLGISVLILMIPRLFSN